MNAVTPNDLLRAVGLSEGHPGHHCQVTDITVGHYRGEIRVTINTQQTLGGKTRPFSCVRYVKPERLQAVFACGVPYKVIA